jgi:hypothetical protein
VNKTFDAVAFMRKRREEIERDDAGLNWEQKTEKTLESLKGDPLWERVKERVAPTGTPLGDVPFSRSTRS